MRKVLVTGATGFVGANVARVLLDRGEEVRVLARRTSDRRNLDGLAVEIVDGDLRDADAVRRAVAGCRRVFHVAADYRLWARDPRELYESNVRGTANVMEAALAEGVERVVYTSTVGTIGLSALPAPCDETTALAPGQLTSHYKRSKLEAERTALAFVARGLDVVVVNPSAPVGPWDVKPTPTGKILVDFAQGRMPAYVDTGLNIVDAADAAEGHWLACEHGRPGQRYILGSENLTLKQIFDLLSSITGRPAPRLRLPWIVAFAAAAVDTLRAQVTGSPPRAPLDAVRMARKKMWVTHARAERELGFRPAPAETALRHAVEWFQAHGYC